MPKRRRNDNDEVQPTFKRSRTGPRRSLLDISDEILIRVLSFLTVQDLLKLEWYPTYPTPQMTQLTPLQCLAPVPLTCHRPRTLESEILRCLDQGSRPPCTRNREKG